VADLSKVTGVTDWWHTDGISIWRKGGAKLSGKAAAAAVQESFEQAARKLPFRTSGDDVFFQCIRLDDGKHRLYAIDPGWLDPKERRIRIHSSSPFRLRDLMTGEAIEVKDGAAQIVVPAGALRILEAVR
jgi:hypothetical protein